MKGRKHRAPALFLTPGRYPDCVKKTEKTPEKRTRMVLSKSEIQDLAQTKPKLRAQFAEHFDRSGLLRVNDRGILLEKDKAGAYIVPAVFHPSNRAIDGCTIANRRSNTSKRYILPTLEGYLPLHHLFHGHRQTSRGLFSIYAD